MTYKDREADARRRDIALKRAARDEEPDDIRPECEEETTQKSKNNEDGNNEDSGKAHTSQDDDGCAFGIQGKDGEGREQTDEPGYDGDVGTDPVLHRECVQG